MDVFLTKENALMEKGFGIETEEGLVLNALEILYLHELGELPKDIEVNIKELRDKYWKAYRVYKHLRKNGYIVRFSLEGDFLRVYRKGFRRGEDRTLYLIKILEPDKNLTIGEVIKDVELASALRKELVYAIVGEKITFLSIGKRNFQ